MLNISFMYKVPFFDKDNHIGKIYLSPDDQLIDNTDVLFEILKKYVLTGINLYRKELRILTVSNVDIGILGSTNLLSTKNENNMFELYLYEVVKLELIFE